MVRGSSDEVARPAPNVGVAGFLGRTDERDVAVLMGRLGARSSLVHQDQRCLLVASADLRRWEHGSESGWSWGQALASPTVVTDWRDIARWWGSAGLSLSPTSVRLHTDAMGAIPVFVRHLDGRVAFSSSVDCLAHVGPGGLHPDPQAWAEIIAGGTVMSTRTAFLEIARLPPGSSLRLDAEGIHEDQDLDPFPVTRTVPGDREAARESIDRLTSALSRIRGDELVVPLSGGWDSRFIAKVATNLSRSIHTVTAADEFGREDEPGWAKRVAERLGLPNDQLEPPNDWWEAFKFAVSVQDYLTSRNHWLVPLRRYLEASRSPILDGLGGDVFIRMNVPDHLADADASTIVSGIHERFAPDLAGHGLLAEDVAAEIDHQVQRTVEAHWDLVKEHPARLHLLNYHLRTPTGIGLVPTTLLARGGAPLALPFLAAEVLEFTASVDPRDKRSGRWYQQIMAALGDGMDEIPSTNDTKPQLRLRRRVDLAPHVLQEVTRCLDHECLQEIIGPRLRASVANGTVLDPDLKPMVMVVRGLCVYSLWVDRYSDRLATTAFPHRPATQRRSTMPSYTTVPDVPEQLGDRDWLVAQIELPACVISLTEQGCERFVVSVDAIESTRTVAVTGWPNSHEEFADVLDDTVTALPESGRVVLSLRLPTAGTAGLVASTAELCEAISRQLDLIHVAATTWRLRVIGTPAQGSDRTVPAELYANAIRGLERRSRLLNSRVKGSDERLARIESEHIAELMSADEATARERARASELESQLADVEEDLVRLRSRRVVRLADRVGVKLKRFGATGRCFRP